MTQYKHPYHGFTLVANQQKDGKFKGYAYFGLGDVGKFNARIDITLIYLDSDNFKR